MESGHRYWNSWKTKRDNAGSEVPAGQIHSFIHSLIHLTRALSTCAAFQRTQRIDSAHRSLRFTVR